MAILVAGSIDSYGDMMKINCDALLQPISTASPCGEDMSFSVEYDRIQDARREDDPNVDYGEWQTDLKQADWNLVVSSCSELLQFHSKDLRLAAWLAEGLVRTGGLRGLADGMEVMARLIESFGDQLHPQADDGDLERRIGTFSWYATRISQLVRQVPLTDCRLGRYDLNDYESACQLRAQLQRNPEAIADIEDRVTLEKIAAAAGKTEKQLYIQWLEDGERCTAGARDLARICDQQFGDEMPSFSQLIENIEAVRQRLESIARDQGLAAPTNRAVEVSSSSEDGGRIGSRAGAIENRVQALECLRDVAAFFRRTEPHSPVAYLAEKAARWGSIPLHLWLRNVVKDHGTLSHLEEMLGLDMDAQSGE